MEELCVLYDSNGELKSELVNGEVSCEMENLTESIVYWVSES